jgi:hypothetical protein
MLSACLMMAWSSCWGGGLDDWGRGGGVACLDQGRELGDALLLGDVASSKLASGWLMLMGICLVPSGLGGRGRLPVGASTRRMVRYYSRVVIGRR